MNFWCTILYVNDNRYFCKQIAPKYSTYDPISTIREATHAQGNHNLCTFYAFVLNASTFLHLYVALFLPSFHRLPSNCRRPELFFDVCVMFYACLFDRTSCQRLSFVTEFSFVLPCKCTKVVAHRSFWTVFTYSEKF